jgi:hypothetical protein
MGVDPAHFSEAVALVEADGVVVTIYDDEEVAP